MTKKKKGNKTKVHDLTTGSNGLHGMVDDGGEELDPSDMTHQTEFLQEVVKANKPEKKKSTDFDRMCLVLTHLEMEGVNPVLLSPAEKKEDFKGRIKFMIKLHDWKKIKDTDFLEDFVWIREPMNIKRGFRVFLEKLQLVFLVFLPEVNMFWCPSSSGRIAECYGLNQVAMAEENKINGYLFNQIKVEPSVCSMGSMKRLVK